MATGVSYQMSHALVLLFTGYGSGWGPRARIRRRSFLPECLGLWQHLPFSLTQMSERARLRPWGLSLIAGWCLSVAVLRVKGCTGADRSFYER